MKSLGGKAIGDVRNAEKFFAYMDFGKNRQKFVKTSNGVG